MKITWLTASSAFLRNSAIFSSVWRLISLIIVVSWWVGMPSDPRCCNIEIARFVFSTIPLMHDSMVWILRHSSSPLVVPEPLPFAWLVAPPLTRFPRDELSDLSSRSSRLLLCCWRRKYIYGRKIKILFSTDLEISFAPSLHRRWSVEDNWGSTGRKKQLLKSLPRVVLWAFLILISNYHTFAPRRQKKLLFSRGCILTICSWCEWIPFWYSNRDGWFIKCGRADDESINEWCGRFAGEM